MPHIKLLVEGGSMQPGPALSQQIGPLGLNMGQVISKVNEATSDFKGLKVPVELEIDAKTKEIEVKVFSPPVSELLKKQLKIDKGSGEQKKLQMANASIEDIIAVSKTKLPNMLCNDLKAAVKTVAGTCVSLGVLIETKEPTEIIQEIDNGKYDKEIQEGKTETTQEKRSQLEEDFKNIHTKQEKALKAEEEAAKEAEEAKAAVPAAGADAKAAPAEAKPAAKAEKK